MTCTNTGSKKYLLIFIFLVIAGMGILAVTSVYIQPLSGDLTRLGGYSERDFGWNISRNVLSNEIKLPSKYDKYYDIVVLGDSFSKSGMWQAFFVQHRNLSFTTLNWDDTTAQEVLNNNVFKSTPPKIFIIEMGIRTFPKHFASIESQCDPNSLVSLVNIEKINLPKTSSSSISFVETKRDITTDFSKINLKFALLYLQNSLLRLLFNNDFTKVKNYSLTRNDLFSNKNNEEILVLNSLFDNKVWNDDEINNALCGAFELQSKVQFNGKTFFILLLIPDKGTAYSKYIINPNFASVKNITDKLASKQINITELDSLLNEAIDKGEKDIYLPNDTHFGTQGYEITARSIYKLLDQKGVAQ